MSSHRHSEDKFVSFDGLVLFHQRWIPDGSERAVVTILHGLGEHSSRYAHVAQALVDSRFAVHAMDHRGHGRSEGSRCFVKSYGDLMRDISQYRALVESEHAGQPHFVLGHSMGGNLALSHALDHQDGLAGLILSAPALRVGDDFTAGQLKVFALLGRYLPRVRPQALNSNAISRDPAVVAAYRADPLVFAGKISAGLGWALIAAMDTFPPRYKTLRIPTLLMHGTADTLTNIEGTRELERGATDSALTAHYYDGLFHEVFNEPEQLLVLADLTAWLESVLS